MLGELNTNVHELNSPANNVGDNMVNIAVLVKQVPDTNSKIQISGDKVDLSSVKMDISPYDEFAVENALQHKESAAALTTAITVGGAGADKVLKGVKALGVDNIVRLDFDGFTRDSNGLQSMLAAEISAGGYDVVYCGKSAADTGAGSTGPGHSRETWLGICFKCHRYSIRGWTNCFLPK